LRGVLLSASANEGEPINAALLSDSLSPTVTDAELMEAVAKADARAFAWLMQRHLKSMIALAQRITHNSHEAEEIAQEGFLRLWKNAPNWDPNGKATLKTWLSRVVINLCLDRLRRRRSVPLEEASEVPDPSASAFETMFEDDKRKAIQLALDDLPERQRVAVVLSYFQDLSDAEVAASMRVTIRAVESLLVRARRSLRTYVIKHGIAGSEDL
jgi:RNA polymerase sigma-70 factor (ECF subfamily)